MDLALNNLQRLIYHKTQQTKPNQTKFEFLAQFPVEHLAHMSSLILFLRLFTAFTSYVMDRFVSIAT